MHLLAPDPAQMLTCPVSTLRLSSSRPFGSSWWPATTDLMRRFSLPDSTEPHGKAYSSGARQNPDITARFTEVPRSCARRWIMGLDQQHGWFLELPYVLISLPVSQRSFGPRTGDLRPTYPARQARRASAQGAHARDPQRHLLPLEKRLPMAHAPT